MVSAAARRRVEAAWRGTGRWLARLHAQRSAPGASPTRVSSLADEILVRVDRWEAADPAGAALAAETRLAVRSAVGQAAGRAVHLALCHGDVTPGNIFVHGEQVGLLDLDDLRVDLPALDLSQARLAIEEFGHLGLPALAGRRARTTAWLRALAEGYGRPLPDGPEYWLPHLRNLVVYLLTLAPQRTGAGAGRLAAELRYRRLAHELGATLSDVQRGRASWRRDS